jgi:hypothetical protein
MPLGDRYRAIADALDTIVLPRRFPKGDPRNLQRVRIPCIAIHQAVVSTWSVEAQIKHLRKGCDRCKVRLKRRANASAHM